MDFIFDDTKLRVAPRFYSPDLHQHRYGFCVICEDKYDDIYFHMNNSEVHKPIDGERPPVYCVQGFQSLLIMVPVGTLPRELTEPSECTTCNGVFFKHRLTSHSCTYPKINEGEGNECCLLCQIKTQDIDRHWRFIHFKNESYEIKTLEGRGLKTLLPKNTNVENERAHRIDCSCRDGLISYKNRVIAPCTETH